MDYLSILPFDLKKLLKHYTNYDTWAIVAEIYVRYLQYFDTDHEDVKSGKQAVLEAMNLQHSMNSTKSTDVFGSKCDLLEPKLNVDQLVALSDVKRLLNILTMVKDPSDNFFMRDMFGQINLVLENHKCPLQLIYLKSALSTVKQDYIFILIDTNTYDISNILSNIKHQISTK